MPRIWIALCGTAANACTCGAQPIWNLDVNGADQGLSLYCNAQATANGNPFCTSSDYQPLTITANKLAPRFSYGAEAFDWGASIVAAPHAVGAGMGTTDANATAVLGVSGVGTSQIVIYFRAITNHSTTETSCGYIAAGHAEVAVSLPVQITGGAPGAAYQIGYQFSFSASAATPYESQPPYWPEDGIICSGGADITCPIDTSTSAFSAGYITGYFPERTNGPVVGTGSVIVSPGWSGAGVYPNRLPIMFANLTAVVDDIMTNPAPSGTFDTCSGEFTGRLTLTIGTSIPTGACCRSSDCVVTTQAACSGSFSGNYRGSGTTCTNPSNGISLCCPANINGYGGVTVQDIFDFLAAYFAGAPQGDFNNSGAVTVQDIFDFLAAYFAGC
jgi:hypothetical protein